MLTKNDFSVNGNFHYGSNNFNHDPEMASSDTSVSNLKTTAVQHNSTQQLDFTGFSNATNIVPQPPVNMTCISQVENQTDQINAELNTTKATSLATSSELFQSKLHGYNSTFNSVFDTWSYDKNCNISMKTINVVYSLYNSTGNFIKNVVVSEDPQISQVVNITEQKLPFFTPSSAWSGYETYGSSIQQTDHVYKTEAYWNVPSVSHPFFGGCISECDLGVWTGMSPSPGGHAINGSGALVQTGTSSCTTDFLGCSNGPFWAWYEFYPRPPVDCMENVNANDPMYGDVINEAINNGGDPTKWDIHNIDYSDSPSICTPAVTGYKFNAGSAPYYAQYIDEYLGSNIPLFGSNTMTGYMFDSANGLQSISVPYNKGFYDDYTLNDQNNQNINFGGASSGSFIQFWSPNCSPPETGTNWTLFQSCTLVNNYITGANVEISSGSILTIASGTKLNIDLSQNHIKIDNNGGLLVEGEGEISKN
jgi:hypothetical protein